VDAVVTDLTACLEDSALPLMQFTEAFAVVQVRQLHMVPAAHAQLVHLQEVGCKLGTLCSID